MVSQGGHAPLSSLRRCHGCPCPSQATGLSIVCRTGAPQRRLRYSSVPVDRQGAYQRPLYPAKALSRGRPGVHFSGSFLPLMTTTHTDKQVLQITVGTPDFLEPRDPAFDKMLGNAKTTRKGSLDFRWKPMGHIEITDRACMCACPCFPVLGS